MANPVITDRDNSKLQVFNPVYKQDVITFGAAETHPMGEILGRKHVSGTVTSDDTDVTTGDGTCTALGLAPGGPAIPGDYNLECVEEIANSGRFKLEDPNGRLLTSEIVIPAGAGNDIDFEGFGLKFTLTDGGTDFGSGDKFAITVTADGALTELDPDALDGSENPVAIMTRSRTEADADDYNERVLVAGEVDLEIVEDGSSDFFASGLPQYMIDKLQAIGIVVRPRSAVDIEDND